jgi:hypothetical protein
VNGKGLAAACETQSLAAGFLPRRRSMMTDNKKKGDFDQWQNEDKGGDKKQRDNRNEDSRTGGQNSGHGGHK